MSAIAFNGEIYPAGARAASDQVYDNSNTGLPANVQGALDKTTGNITALDTVELTATAAHAHAAGSTFLWVGQLVKATAAIAVGDTITVGTNVANTDICSVLDELSSNLTPEEWYILNPDYPLYYKKVGNIVFVQFDYQSTNQLAANINIGSLPIGYRPEKEVKVSYNTEGIDRLLVIRNSSQNGNVIIGGSASTGYVEIITSYPV